MLLSLSTHAESGWSYISSYPFIAKDRWTCATVHLHVDWQVPVRCTIVSWSKCWQLLRVFTEAVDTDRKNSAMVNILHTCICLHNTDNVLSLLLVELWLLCILIIMYVWCVYFVSCCVNLLFLYVYKSIFVFRCNTVVKLTNYVLLQ